MRITQYTAIWQRANSFNRWFVGGLSELANDWVKRLCKKLYVGKCEMYINLKNATQIALSTNSKYAMILSSLEDGYEELCRE